MSCIQTFESRCKDNHKINFLLVKITNNLFCKVEVAK